jgi:hypothetical protein
MVFVDSVMDKYDAPIDPTVGAHALADSDYGVTIHPVVRDVTRRFALRWVNAR